MISSKRSRAERVQIEFSIGELVHLRRFLNRAAACCVNHEPKIAAWYYIDPLLKKIDAATAEKTTAKKEESKMSDHWLHLAGGLLDRAASDMSNAGCNDWEWPANWTNEQKKELTIAIMEDNLKKGLDEFTEDEKEELEHYVLGSHGPSDWMVARFLAEQLLKQNT